MDSLVEKPRLMPSPRVTSAEFDKRVRIGLALVSAVLAALAAIFGFLPLQGYLGLNLIAAFEPYFIYRMPMNVFQMFVVAAAQYLLFPFFWFLAYRPIRWLLARSVSAVFRPDGGGLDSTRASRFQRLPQSATRWAGSWKRRAYHFIRFPETVILWIGKWTRRIYFALCAGFVLVEVLLAANFTAKVVQHREGAFAARQDCGRCHHLFRVFNYNMTAGVWDETLSRMTRNTESRQPNLEFPEKERKAILEFLIGVRGYDGPRLVRSKCIRCHALQTPFDTKRTRKEWKLAIDRMHRKNRFFLTVRQAEELSAYIAGNPDWTAPDPLPGSDAAKMLTEKIAFEQKCGLCHTLDIILRPIPGKPDWDAILTRMGTKTPSVLSAEESRSFRPLIEHARSDAQAFYSAFPHATAARGHP